MARTGVALAALVAMVLVNLTGAAPGLRMVAVKTDALYFPDQVEYIRASHGKCTEEPELLYWPGDRRCYAEGTQGPCPFEFRLVWDERQLRPHCERDNSLFDSR